MRKDFNVPEGIVHSLWIDSESLVGNLLGDPTRRRVDVYVPAGHDGRDLPLLVDLVGYTAGGPAHTNWKNYGENVPERLDRLIGTGAMPPVVVAFPDCFTRLGGNQYIDSSRHRPLGELPHRRNAALRRAAFRLRRRWAARRFRQELRRIRLAGPRAAPRRHGLVGGGLTFGRCRVRVPLPSGRVRQRALRHLVDHEMSIEKFVRKFEAGPKAKDADWHTMMVLAQAATFDPDPEPVLRHSPSRRHAHLRAHRRAVGQLAAMGSAPHGGSTGTS